MRPRFGPGVAALAALLVAGPGCDSSAAPPGLVVLVSVDTLRADRLNTYGYAARRISPHLDALAADGVTFESHIAASPWTTPSHMSLLTGLYPTAHGITSSFGELWQGLEGRGRIERLAPAHRTLAEVLAANGWATAAFTGGVTLDPRIGFARGFQVYDTSMVKLSARKIDALLAWLDGAPDEPRFVFWHTFEVHAPYLDTTFLGDVLPADRAEAVSRSLSRLARQPGWKEVGDGIERLRSHHAYTRPVCDALYDGGVLAFDGWLGRLLEGLKARHLYDDSLIVVTSDHGEQIGERGGGMYNVHGHTLYEELVRVPLIVKLPGRRRAGTRVGSVTRAIDVMPTLLDLAGVPDAGRPPVQGRSLVPVLDGGALPPEPAFSEALSKVFEKKGVRTGRYKYVVTIDSERVTRRGRAHIPARPDARELFDLSSDPLEIHDLLSRGDAAAEREATTLDATLRAIAAMPRGEAEAAPLDAELEQRLRALGYVQ